MNPIDSLIGYFNPRAGLLRQVFREQLRAYEAASPRDKWKPRRAGASANTDHAGDAATVRHKARSLVQNAPFIASGMRALVANVVGTGITSRWTGSEAEQHNALWAKWITECDADGRLDWYGMQAAAYRAMEIDGEVLVRLRPRRPADGLAVPLQLQLLEIDWLDSGKTTTVGGNQVIAGIEYDALGRTVAYWLFDRHPGDAGITLRGVKAASHRVPAESIIHLYNPERPGQGRGFSRLAPVVATARDVRLYQDAELARKNLESRLAVLYSGDATGLANPIGSADPAAAARGGDLGQLASGGIQQLPPGGSVHVVAPTPAHGSVEYLKQQLHFVASAMGVTYEMLTGDLAEVNFSSARTGALEFRRQAEQTQWLLLVPKLIGAVCRAFAAAAEAAGKVRAASASIEHSTPKWDYVNPEQEVKADLLEVAGGLSSISEKLRRRGYDPRAVFAEMKSDFDELKRLDVLDILFFLQKGTFRLTEEKPEPTAGSGGGAKA